MTFIEFTTQVMKKQKQQKVEIIPVTSGSITLFDQILDMDDMIKATFDATESATKFYQIYPDIKEALKGQDYKSIFYAYKLGYAYTGVPNDLAYVLYKSLSGLGKKYVNTAIFGAFQYLKSYADTQWISEAGEFTLKDLIDNVYGKHASLITESNPIVKSDDSYELYVGNVDRVALLPDDIGKTISFDDAQKIEFDQDKGIMLGTIPLRTFNNRLGVTLDDFDLRECI